MPPTPSCVALEALLREIPSLRRGETPQEAPARWPTGFAALDRLLGGGFPRGRLCEIAGPPSSGRTSLALALLATATRAGESAAVVDAADAFDPASATAAQVDLERTLWVRAAGARTALRAADLLLRAGGFALVLLDLQTGREASEVSFLRLARAASAAGATVVVIGDSRVAGSHAELAVEMRLVGPRFHGGPGGAPILLAELESEAVAVRRRGGPGSARLRFRAPEA